MKTRMFKSVKVATGSGNVFRDLNFGKIESEDLKWRSGLMMRVERFVRESKLMHAEAARALGVSEARLTLLQKGKIGRFSVGGLNAMLANAGLVDEVACEGVNVELS
jgi:predicted XRE-type DNA-binding protein